MSVHRNVQGSDVPASERIGGGVAVAGHFRAGVRRGSGPRSRASATRLEVPA